MNITNIYADPDCPDCNGTGERDSGGTHPWGEPIYLACDCVDEQIGKRWRTNSSLENWFPLTAEKLGQLSSDLEDAQGEMRALRATEAGLRERVKELEEGVAGFKVRVNTLAALGLKAERFDFGGRLKYDMTALLEKKE